LANIKNIKINSAKIKLTKFLVKAGMASSNGDARRKIEQRGVSVDGEKVSDFKIELNKKEHNNKIIKVGKIHFAKINYGK